MFRRHYFRFGIKPPEKEKVVHNNTALKDNLKCSEMNIYDLDIFKKILNDNIDFFKDRTRDSFKSFIEWFESYGGKPIEGTSDEHIGKKAKFNRRLYTYLDRRKIVVKKKIGAKKDFVEFWNSNIEEIFRDGEKKKN